MSIVAPNYNIPSCNATKSMIEKVYDDRKCALFEEIDKVENEDVHNSGIFNISKEYDS